MSDAPESVLNGLLQTNPELFEAADHPCDEEELAELEGLLGRPLPRDLHDLLRWSDGGLLHGAHGVLRFASVRQLAIWVQSGVVDEFAVLPFAHDDTDDSILVIDEEGDWGDPAGAVYRVSIGKRATGGYDAIRLSDSVRQLVEHVVAGRDAW